MNEKNPYRADLGSEVNEYCDDCYEEVDNKYPNIL